MGQVLVTRRMNCRLCEANDLKLVFPMKPSPIGDAFIRDDQKNDPQPLIPLDVYQCQQCGHAQNLDIVNPEVLFRDYIFTTGSSAGLVKHFQQYAQAVANKLELQEGASVIEIGSNDGTLLKFFKDLGMKCLGIDPACAIAKEATHNGIPTLAEFYSSNLARQILSEYGPSKLIVANNVYAHSDQLADITEGIALLLDPDGAFVFEVSYLVDMIDHFLFDTIYHEHLSYHSITPLVKFFGKYHLEIFDIERIPSKGGSIRCFVQKKNGPRAQSQIVEQMVKEELLRGLHRPLIFHRYQKQIQAHKAALHRYLSKKRQQKQRIAGYGASTTVTTLTYQFELENILDYLIDDNVKKHGLFSPGRHLAVKASTELYENPPDIVIILAWQYAQAILQKHARFVENNGIFVIPLPELKVILNKNVSNV